MTVKVKMKPMLQAIKKATVDMDAANIGRLVKESLEAGDKPMKILDALKEGMDEVGNRYEANEYFLADLIMAGETMRTAMEVLKPHLSAGAATKRGKVVLGTIEGDLHDIGKEIVRSLLLSAGIEVYDLGIDVPPKRFVEKAMEVKADVIGISALLSLTQPQSARVVEELKKEGIREKVKVITGGAAARPYHVQKYGVDASVNSAVEGLRIIQKWCSRDEP